MNINTLIKEQYLKTKAMSSLLTATSLNCKRPISPAFLQVMDVHFNLGGLGIASAAGAGGHKVFL